VARYGSSYSYQFGPGPPGPAVKALLIANVVAWVINLIVPTLTLSLGLSPKDVFTGFALWQPFTYMFLHDTQGFGHILFNMLSLWMFGTELERTWGTRFFTKYYLVTGCFSPGRCTSRTAPSTSTSCSRFPPASS
jgi:membrane associated rhomboid family serine protease